MKKMAIIAVLMSSVMVAALAAPAQAATKHVHAFAPYSKSAENSDDKAPPGPSQGDEHSGYFKMFNHGKGVGHFDYTCVTTHVDPGREECHATAHFTGRGRIVVEGNTNSGAQKSRVAITGGTGEFNGASGNLVLNFRRHGAHLRFNLR
jgi:opacity protein-like surface antigen